MNKVVCRLLLVLLQVVSLAAGASLLSSCQSTGTERQELRQDTRQSTRTGERTEDRMERRRDAIDD